MPTLTIRHRIPVTSEEWAGPTVWFDQWIPERDTDVITRHQDGVAARLRTEKECVSSLEPVTDDLISRWTNIGVRSFVVEVEVEDVSDELAAFIYEERDSPKQIHGSVAPGDPRYERLAAEYKSLGQIVLSAALGIFNRVLAFARNHKGQYWLPLRAVNFDRMSSLNNEFNARVSTKSFASVRWCPPAVDRMTIHTPSRDASISREEWRQVREFAAGHSRPDIVLELLANARLLLQSGQRRSAIIEAVSALELAISRFGDSPDPDKISDHFRNAEPGGLQKSIEHLGFSTSLRYLLPLALVDLDPAVHAGSVEAADIRNNVVHNGQRDVKEAQVRPLIGNVEKCCHILKASTLVAGSLRTVGPDSGAAS